ncbi:MFS general substrate transporter [Aureobasidium pullulans]|uniref:MFS general substrate transporter n=1 Tax=Aureobasidium pullulans TaxID=5580 RepID=A0A4S9AKV3_AURPU|nr:MFS general substrate transporter [Aureobasidium pullulans]THY21079.1 MFS general substrate transporter [Aureobasidium pullulans]
MAGQIDVEKNVESKGLEKTLIFDDDPSLNPQNFSQARKILVLSIAVLLTTSSTCGTSLASGGAKATLRDFGLPEAYGWEVLPVSIYLVGYFIGNTALAPLSENYGRRPVNLSTIVFYMIWMMACALAPNWAAFNVFRLLNGFFSAGAPATVSGNNPGIFIELAVMEIVLRPISLSRICADLYSDDMRRGRALLWYNMATTLGSTLGPLISGFAVFDNWRLSYWIGLGYGGICFLGNAWTSRPSIHWSSSVLSGVLYGLGYTLNFNALLNYLVDGYASYASSANAASSLTRQIMGAALPFAAVPMYDALGVGWASSLLGFVAAIMSIIPFLFWMYGEKLLAKSILAQELAREKERECR